MDKEILNKDTFTFVTWIIDNFTEEVPDEVSSIQQATQASRLIARIANEVSYLNSLSAYLKCLIRREKELKHKDNANDYIDKKNAVDVTIDSLELQYKAISRMITVRSDELKELSMNGQL